MEQMVTKQQISLGSFIDTMRNHIDNYQTWLPEIAVYTVVSFVCGFLCKNFGRWILIALVVAIVTILLLEQVGIVAAPFQQLAELVGIRGISSLQDLAWAKLLWMQNHPLTTLGALIGFVLGWKIG